MSIKQNLLSRLPLLNLPSGQSHSSIVRWHPGGQRFQFVSHQPEVENKKVNLRAFMRAKLLSALVSDRHCKTCPIFMLPRHAWS